MKYLHFALLAIFMIAGCDQTNRTTTTDSSGNSTTKPSGSSMSAPSGSSMTSSSGNNASKPVDSDNSAVNKRDRDGDAKTPIDQNENQADIDVTAGIRKRLVGTKMSVNAQNVKIITQDGVVTLRGPVKTMEEKKQIEEIARSVAGVKTVDSQLEVEKNP